MNKSQRSFEIDFIKAFAICLVVLGHSIQLFNGTEYRMTQSFYNNLIYKIIYSFHMPLFMLVSGYLYYYGESKYIHNLKNNIIKIMSYLIPIVTFASIKTAVNLFTGYDDRQHILFVILKEEAYNILHTLWFLWAIIYSIIILEVIRHLINGVSKQYKWKWLALLLVILMIIFLFTPDVLMGNVYKFTIPFLA